MNFCEDLLRKVRESDVDNRERLNEFEKALNVSRRPFPPFVRIEMEKSDASTIRDVAQNPSLGKLLENPASLIVEETELRIAHLVKGLGSNEIRAVAANHVDPLTIDTSGLHKRLSPAIEKELRRMVARIRKCASSCAKKAMDQSQDWYLNAGEKLYRTATPRTPPLPIQRQRP